MDIIFKNSLFILTLLLSFISSANTNHAEPLPISAYGSLPNISHVKLSPNGESVAMIQNRKGTLVLVVHNFITGDSQVLLQADNVDVVLNWFNWGNNDILLISAAYTTKQRLTKYTSTRLYKFDLSAEKKLQFLT